MTYKDFKKLTTEEKYTFFKKEGFKIKNSYDVAFPKFTFLIRSWNQYNNLIELIPNILPYASEIIIFDDASTDRSSYLVKELFGDVIKIVLLPEGWSFTHGDSKRYLFWHRISSSRYAFQIDTDERLFIANNTTWLLDKRENVWSVNKLNINYIDHYNKNDRLSFRYSFCSPQLSESSNPRIVDTHNIPIWEGLVHPQLPSKTPIGLSPLYLVHLRDFDFSRNYWLRRERLYIKLMKEGFETEQNSRFSNAVYSGQQQFWVNTLKKIENEIGVLRKTKEKPLYVGWNNEELEVIHQIYKEIFCDI